MGHDIAAQNKTGDIIAYLRYTMWDVESNKVYELLGVEDYNGGVSGIGITAEFTKPQIDRALQAFNQIRLDPYANEFENWQHDELQKFLTACLKTAENEGEVSIYFG